MTSTAPAAASAAAARCDEERAPSTVPARVAVLASGGGSNLAALVDALASDPGLGGQVVVVATDRPDAGAIGVAAARGLPTLVHPFAAASDRPTWEASLVADLRTHAPDLVVLAGFLRVVSPSFLSAWPGRVLNIHPSLLPAFPGAHAVRDALAHGVRITGTTVHVVDEQVDHGPIVAQRCVEVRDGDTVDLLHARIRAEEHVLLPEVVAGFCRGELRVEDGRLVRAPGGPVSRADGAPA
ncbi:MAG: hypothetical protein RLZZ272_1288 [Actinomycetota bacterium]